MRKIIFVALTAGALVVSTQARAKLIGVTIAPAANISKALQKSARATSACLTSCGFSGIYGECALGPNERPRIGYQNVYDPGTSPCNCWSWQACSWREFMRFDFGSLQSKAVVESHLHFIPHVHQAKSGTALGSSAQCTIRIYVAEFAWNKYAIPGELIATINVGPTTPGNGVNLQIGGIVRQWVNGQRANRGLFFVGPNEKLASESNDRCYVELSDVSLVVTVNAK